MVSDFQKKHLRIFLETLTDEPLDVQLNRYLRQNKAIGSKDRKIIGDTTYAIVRQLGFIDAHLEGPITWASRIEQFLQGAQNRPLAPHERVSFPKEFYDLMAAKQGVEATEAFCQNSNLPAPITIRANTHKISRDALFERLKEYPISKCANETGIVFHKRINFFTLDAFKEGLFEVQDEASQLVAGEVAAKPGDEILDYCAGSGGKSLAIAPRLQGRGQLFLHDVRKRPLLAAKQRFKRAGIQTFQLVETLPKALLRRMDWILLDVPCSGSGTWRRNPDQKWKFSKSLLLRLVEEQRSIIAKALPYLHPNGKLVYATCSVLAEENEEQVAWIEKTYNLLPVKPFFKSTPQPNEKDGFFAAVLAYSSL